MDYVAETIAGRGPWVLLDEQFVVFEKIRAAVASAVSPRQAARGDRPRGSGDG